MKANRTVSLLVVVAMMIVALSGIALAAVPSPTGSTATGVSDNVKKVSLSSVVKDKNVKDLAKAVSAITKDSIKAALPKDADIDLDAGNYELVELITAEVSVVITGNKPGTIELNVAGAKAGDTILVLVLLPNGKTELVPATVVADGVIQFQVKRNCTVSVIKMVPEGESVGFGLPATGDTSSMLPMIMLLMLSVTALGIATKSLKATK